jgi:hemoglobin
MQDILNRTDVKRLVNTFYTKIRAHETLGPIFLSRISGDKEWEKHEEKLTDFWESNLFFKSLYNGNPLKPHLEVDKEQGHSLGQEHFGMWLQLWVSNIDEHFSGDTAQIAKNKARNMAHFMFMQIFEGRSTKM